MRPAHRAFVLTVGALLLGAGRSASQVDQVAAAAAAAAYDSATGLYWQGYYYFQQGSRESVQQAVTMWQRAGQLFLRAGRERDFAATMQALALAHSLLGAEDSARTYNARADSSSVLFRLSRSRLGVQSGAVFGVSVGLATFGGSSNAPIQSGSSFEAHFGYAVPAGWQFVGGVQYERHRIERSALVYQALGLFVEPRYFLLRSSPTFAAYVGARAGPVWETVSTIGAVFRGAGFTFGGTAGAQVRVARQAVLGGGLTGGIAHFGDFDFDGAQVWEGCVGDFRATATPLPVTVHECAQRVPAVVPLFTQSDDGFLTGVGPRQRIPHPGSRRSGSWTRLWLGMTVLVSPR